MGILGGDLAGFPNGRRLTDDVVTIELRAVAGATYPLVQPAYTPDGAVAAIEDGTFNNPGRVLLDGLPLHRHAVQRLRRARCVMQTHSHHELGETPVLDIGGDVGALVVHLDTVPQSGELEACPRARPDLRFHTGVHWRQVGGRRVAVAVYPAVVQGDYEILDADLRPVGCVRVEGGKVAQLRLRPRVSAG